MATHICAWCVWCVVVMLPFAMLRVSAKALVAVSSCLNSFGEGFVPKTNKSASICPWQVCCVTTVVCGCAMCELLLSICVCGGCVVLCGLSDPAACCVTSLGIWSCSSVVHTDPTHELRGDSRRRVAGVSCGCSHLCCWGVLG